MTGIRHHTEFVIEPKKLHFHQRSLLSPADAQAEQIDFFEGSN